MKNYLEGLESTKPKRGRKRTPETIGAQIAKVEAELIDAPPLARLKLIQQRIDLLGDLEALSGPAVDMTQLEAQFVRVAAAYSKAQGISYGAWREFGVEADVLKQAGISRSAS